MKNLMKDIAYVRYAHPDLDLMRRFLTDFGLTEVSSGSDILMMRAATGYPYCYIAHKGPASQLLSIGIVFGDDEAINAAAQLPEASRKFDSPRFDGDATVSIRDPDGYEFDLLPARQVSRTLSVEAPEVFNFGTHKTRLNTGRLAPPRPPVVLRLGHVALKVKDVAESMAWYAERFGLLASDAIYEDHPDNLVTAFMRCNLGAKHADHHVIALAAADHVKLHHISFEVQGLDQVGAGGQWLALQGYERLWGIGRHLLGGQIFDYWRDPYGNNVEHYADGDVFDDRHAATIYRQSIETLYQWGPPLPSDFAD
jgi:catechol 2,3-dioxygenase-like lactoylglutathione lyase family enzyme